jgi:AcrR family transcriptional regulator
MALVRSASQQCPLFFYSFHMDPSDPRAVKTRSLILDATTNAIVELGLHDVTMDDIASRARISRSTLYRHWQQLGELLMAAIQNAAPNEKLTETKDPLERLVAIISGLGAGLRQQPWANMAASLAEYGSRNPEFGRFHADHIRARRLPAVRAVRAAQRNGSLPKHLDPEWFVTALAGPIYYHHLVLHQPLTTKEVSEHITNLLTLVKT